MRAKQIWDFVPLPAKAKLLWDRFTSSRLTKIYVLFSLIHFVLQITLQIQAYSINANAASLLFSIALQGNATNSSFPTLAGPEIRMCANVPTDLNTGNCTTVYDGIPNTNNHEWSPLAATADRVLNSTVAATSSPLASASSATPSASSSVASASASSAAAPVSAALPSVVVVTQLVTVAPDPTPTLLATSSSSTDSVILSGFYKRTDFAHAKVLSLSNETVQVNITGLGFQNYPLLLDRSCMWSLNWPVSVLDNTKREDIVFIAFQFWVLGMSVVALLNESIPHIIASLLTHVLATAWSGFQISQTADFQKSFGQYIVHGACDGVPSLLPNYWEGRARLEISTLALNVAALIISAILTWKLVKVFGWQTFKRVGASLAINRVYKLVLFFSIVLQLGLFFMGATVSLFLDQLINGWVGHLAWFGSLYKIMFIITGLLLIPWIVSGWYSVRQEKRLGMILFLGLSMWYLAGWGVMFLSTTFRWTFRTWQFFAMVASVSIGFSLLSFLLGIVCRCNFGKGLLRYLDAQAPLPGDDFQRMSGGDEKVAFPSTEKPVPTFSATFGSGSEVPVPSQMFRPAPQLGPRFFNSSAEPFESRPNSSTSSPIAPPMAALTRTSTAESYRSKQSNVTAIPSKHDSGRSFGSLTSYYDYSAGDSNHARRDSETGPTMVGNAKRWVIDD